MRDLARLKVRAGAVLPRATRAVVGVALSRTLLNGPLKIGYSAFKISAKLRSQKVQVMCAQDALGLGKRALT